MEAALIAASVIGGWLFLCVVSSERERAIHEKTLREITFKPTETPDKNSLDTAKN